MSTKGHTKKETINNNGKHDKKKIEKNTTKISRSMLNKPVR